MKVEGSRKEKIEWDKLKIAIFAVLAFLLLFAGYEIKGLTLDRNASRSQSEIVETNVKNNSAINSSTPNVTNTIEQSIEGLKKEASNINVEDLATSSPQVQKVINDLKALRNYPSNQLKDACFKICNGL